MNDENTDDFTLGPYGGSLAMIFAGAVGGMLPLLVIGIILFVLLAIDDGRKLLPSAKAEKRRKAIEASNEAFLWNPELPEPPKADLDWARSPVRDLRGRHLDVASGARIMYVEDRMPVDEMEKVIEHALAGRELSQPEKLTRPALADRVLRTGYAQRIKEIKAEIIRAQEIKAAPIAVPSYGTAYRTWEQQKALQETAERKRLDYDRQMRLALASQCDHRYRHGNPHCVECGALYH